MTSSLARKAETGLKPPLRALHDGVKPDAVVLIGEGLARASEARLDLVGDEQDLVLPAEGGGLLQEALGRDVDARLALYRLHQEGAGVGRDGFLESLGIAEGDDLEAGGKGAEAVLVGFLGAEAHDGGGAAVEVVGADDDLGLVLPDALYLLTPLAGGLDGGLYGLGTRVHGQYAVISRQLADLLAEQGQLVVAEGAAGEGDLGGLATQRLEDARVTVTLVHGAVGREKIHVAFAFDVFDPDALGLADNDVERVVVVGSEAVLDGDELVRLHGKPPPGCRDPYGGTGVIRKWPARRIRAGRNRGPAARPATARSPPKDSFVSRQVQSRQGPGATLAGAPIFLHL